MKTDFPPAADAVVYAPSEQLVDLDATTIRPNAKRKAKLDWGPEDFKLFDGHDGLLVRTVLVRSDHFDKNADRLVVQCKADIQKLCSHMRYLDQEHMVVIAINNAGVAVAIYEVAVGHRAGAPFSPLDVIKIPILTGCSNFIMVHNHPSGSITPSEDDRRATTKMSTLCGCVGLRLLDHVIIGNGAFSFMEEGLL